MGSYRRLLGVMTATSVLLPCIPGKCANSRRPRILTALLGTTTITESKACRRRLLAKTLAVSILRATLLSLGKPSATTRRRHLGSSTTVTTARRLPRRTGTALILRPL